DRPVTPVNSWSFYEIIGDVDADASTINLGLLMRGNGRSWIDDASFEVIGNSDPLEPARTLTTRGLQNLQALARLYGYVHYFHPSDEAAAADWNRLAIVSVRVVESAATAEELATRLQNVFGPIAPGVRIF